LNNRRITAIEFGLPTDFAACLPQYSHVFQWVNEFFPGQGLTGKQEA
jgi:uncharacterized protein YgfB (UPF0149 family)